MRLIAPIICALILLTSCSSPSVRYPAVSPVVSGSIPTSVRSLEVRDISLPSYAESEEIHVQNADGSLTSSSTVLWADLPVRSMSLELSQNIATLTGARVASQPWPFEEPPQARLEVRMNELLAGADGIFRASGQYFVSSTQGGRDRSGFFTSRVPFDSSAGPLAISKARGQVIVQLAQKIANDGM